MPENITLSNGMQIKVKDGLSDEEIVSIARQADPATSKHFEDIEDNFDIQTGVKDADLRFSLALADQNPKEVKLVMDEKVGEGNWGTPLKTISMLLQKVCKEEVSRQVRILL